MVPLLWLKHRKHYNFMNHWIIAPVLLPLLAGIVLLLGARLALRWQRLLNVIATTALVPLSIVLLVMAAGGDYFVYTLGDWPAPFGIVLVLDRLSALLLLLTALVAFFSLLYALQGDDSRGRYFHVLLQWQLLGLNGAFLTGDLFNLFVFFEILLIASYGLLLHGGGPARARAGLHYVVLNLAGSALFLLALGVIYGVTGSLNMADVAGKAAALVPAEAALVRTGALLLLVVFALKAALLPLYFWLPSAYSSASAPVAALFAIMTKVGVYTIVRVFILVFGSAAGNIADVAAPWLLPTALATLATGALGTLASRDLRRLIAYFVVVSIGTLLAAVGVFDEPALSAALLYLIHTTLVTAGMFLLADLISRQRGPMADRLDSALPVAQPLLLGACFFTGSVALTGLPPLSGFLGKFMILNAVHDSPALPWVWSVVLISSLVGIVALVRAGSVLFWRTAGATTITGTAPATAALPMVALLICSPALVIFAGPVTDFTRAAAQQLNQPSSYVQSVLQHADQAAKRAPGEH